MIVILGAMFRTVEPDEMTVISVVIAMNFDMSQEEVMNRTSMNPDSVRSACLTYVYIQMVAITSLIVGYFGLYTNICICWIVMKAMKFLEMITVLIMHRVISVPVPTSTIISSFWNTASDVFLVAAVVRATEYWRNLAIHENLANMYIDLSTPLLELLPNGRAFLRRPSGQNNAGGGLLVGDALEPNVQDAAENIDVQRAEHNLKEPTAKFDVQEDAPNTGEIAAQMDVQLDDGDETRENLMVLNTADLEYVPKVVQKKSMESGELYVEHMVVEVDVIKESGKYGVEDTVTVDMTSNVVVSEAAKHECVKKIEIESITEHGIEYISMVNITRNAVLSEAAAELSVPELGSEVITVHVIEDTTVANVTGDEVVSKASAGVSVSLIQCLNCFTS